MFRTYKLYLAFKRNKKTVWSYAGKFRLDKNNLGMYARAFLAQRLDAQGAKLVNYLGETELKLYREEA